MSRKRKVLWGNGMWLVGWSIPRVIPFSTLPGRLICIMAISALAFDLRSP